MAAEGTTKGSIDRPALASVCAATMTTTKETKSWRANKNRQGNAADPEVPPGFVKQVLGVFVSMAGGTTCSRSSESNAADADPADVGLETERAAVAA